MDAFSSAGDGFRALPELEERHGDAFKAAEEQEQDGSGPWEEGKQPERRGEGHRVLFRDNDGLVEEDVIAAVVLGDHAGDAEAEFAGVGFDGGFHGHEFEVGEDDHWGIFHGLGVGLEMEFVLAVDGAVQTAAAVKDDGAFADEVEAWRVGRDGAVAADVGLGDIAGGFEGSGDGA